MIRLDLSRSQKTNLNSKFDFQNIQGLNQILTKFHFEKTLKAIKLDFDQNLHLKWNAQHPIVQILFLYQKISH